jgi:hypothetical protein
VVGSEKIQKQNLNYILNIHQLPSQPTTQRTKAQLQFQN